MWLVIALVLLIAFLISPFIWMSPEAKSLNYGIVRSAVKLLSLRWHAVYLISYDMVMVEQKWPLSKYSVKIKFNDRGSVIVSNLWLPDYDIPGFVGTIKYEREVSLFGPNSIDELGKAIADCILQQTRKVKDERTEPQRSTSH